MLVEVADERRNPRVIPILKQGDCRLHSAPPSARFYRTLPPSTLISSTVPSTGGNEKV
ncbi:MAG: hypothetical protein KME42_19690 [Tildeniella nuda ZEHNDER 1965/U140]|nr:hypothetical protein [Tildeniella nuda ZEHNDER 1965/U140]